MSDYVVQRFFQDESLLSISLGQDGMLGFFADNYPTLIAMSRAIIDQEELTVGRKQDSLMEIRDLREELTHLDTLLSTQGFLDDDDQSRYAEIKEEIKFHEEELETEDPIFFRGEPLRMCAEYEFLSKMETNFPGIMGALCEFDRLLRIPISGFVKKGLGWATLPLKVVVGAILERSNLGVAGQLIYMLVNNYPDIIKQRMQAEMPTGRPANYPEHEIEGFSIKEKKTENVIKFKPRHKNDDN
jgi:hypothetical protein